MYLSIYPPFTLDLGADTNLCEVVAVFLNTYEPHALDYLWQDHSTNATYYVYEDGEYWVRVSHPCKNQNG
ncbi:MAG: hypothetical protein LBU51_11405 [Bacteroidales bacterium]|nr:hypothetical protein [Bacteroidales bacterium]